MTTLQPTKTLKTSKQSNEKLGAYSEAHLDSDVKQLTQPLTPATRVLPRTLSAYSGAMQNIGCNIGAGIFILQGSMIREVGSPGLVISLFVIGGIVSLFGVWSYVELGTMIPISGGAKEYITAAYPKPRGLVAFMFTHVWIWLMMPGQVGAVTVGAGMYLMNVIFGSKNFCIETGVMGGIAYEYGARGIATLCVILIVILHSFLPNAGTAMQNYMSTLKASVLLLALVVGIAAAVGMNGLEHTSNFDNIFLNSVWDPNALIQSFFKVLFIFDGWGTINYSLSELKDPVNNLPKVSFGSFSAIFFLFLGTTLSYFTVVPVADLMDENNDIIAVQFFKRTLGPLFGGKIVPFLIFLAAGSCALSLVYAYSRLIMKCAKDGFMPFGSYLATVSRFNSPMNSLILAGGISLVFVLGPPPGGAYDFLVLLASYPEWIFYGVSVLGVLVLRFSHPEIYRPVKAFLPGTVIFVISCVLLAIVPFVPPKVKPSNGIEYWVVPVVGLTVICLIGGLFLLLGMEERMGADEDIFEEAQKAFKEIEKNKEATCKV